MVMNYLFFLREEEVIALLTNDEKNSKSKIEEIPNSFKLNVSLTNFTLV